MITGEFAPVLDPENVRRASYTEMLRTTLSTHLLVRQEHAARTTNQTANLSKGLALRHPGDEVVVENTPSNRGKLKKILHLVSVEDLTLPREASPHYRRTPARPTDLAIPVGNRVMQATCFHALRPARLPILLSMHGYGISGLGTDLAMAKDNLSLGFEVLFERLVREPLSELSLRENQFREEFEDVLPSEPPLIDRDGEQALYLAGKLVRTRDASHFRPTGHANVELPIPDSAELPALHSEMEDAWCFARVVVKGGKPVSVLHIDLKPEEDAS